MSTPFSLCSTYLLCRLPMCLLDIHRVMLHVLPPCGYMCYQMATATPVTSIWLHATIMLAGYS